MFAELKQSVEEFLENGDSLTRSRLKGRILKSYLTDEIDVDEYDSLILLMRKKEQE